MRLGERPWKYGTDDGSFARVVDYRQELLGRRLHK